MMTLVYMLLFMLIPIWIPIIGATCGFVYDRFHRPAPSRIRSFEERRPVVAAAVTQ